MWNNPLPNVPPVESPFFSKIFASARFSSETIKIAKELHENGYAIIDFPEDDFDRISSSIIKNLNEKYNWDAWRANKVRGLRIQDAWKYEENVSKIAANQKILNLLSDLYGREAFPFQTLNFPVGTQQHFHTDSVHFSSIPERFMCGVWVAFEDVHPSAGPLIYYPKSHKLPIFLNEHLGITPNSKAIDGYGTYRFFEAAWRELVQVYNLEEKKFLPRKGQALIWAANLLHGGGPHLDKSKTRYSQVTHYYFQDCAYYTPLGSLPYLGAIQYYDRLVDIKSGNIVQNKINNIAIQERLIKELDHKARIPDPPNSLSPDALDSRLPDDFDSKVYLQINPDVAARGVNPKKHYLNFGIKEGRKYKLEDAAISYFKRGQQLSREGKLEKAIAAYRKAIDMKPTFSECHFHLGTTLAKKHRWAQAVTYYKKTIELNPDFTSAYCELGDALTAQGKIDQATVYYQKSVYKQILQSNPDFIKDYWELAKVRGPNFVILGSMKCGTTSLYKYIGQHPQFLPCARKEIYFFSHKYNRGINWYLAQFPPLTEENNFFTGEASISYFDQPGTAKRMLENFPNIKLIIILRNPVERTISHYHHIVERHPDIESHSFEEAICSEIDILKKLDTPYSRACSSYEYLHKGYVLRSLYVYFLPEWMTVFPREQFLILKSEDLYKYPAPTMKRVFQFLELPEYQLAQYSQYNSGAYASNISNELYHTLSEFFRPHNQKLEDYLGMDFNWD